MREEPMRKDVLICDGKYKGQTLPFIAFRLTVSRYPERVMYQADYHDGRWLGFQVDPKSTIGKPVYIHKGDKSCAK